MKDKNKKILILIITVVIIISLYFLTKNVSTTYLENLSLRLPLPVFTFIISIVDGFNPCNLFVLTLLISLILSESHSRKRIFAVGYTFVIIVYIFYFLFMATWLNIFKYIGFVDPLRYTIAGIAIIAGLINCKEMFFYRKGITLMIQDKFIGPLKQKIKNLSKLVKKGSLSTLIGASSILAIFTSLVELPCTAGFPLIYTGVLSGIHLKSSILYYLYLALYNLFYVTPLLVLITVLGYTFHGKQIKKETMALIKFIGGSIMLVLGIILLFNPGLVGL